MTQDDMTLVREFAATQSEPAFAALVERHVGMVHSAAWRQTGDAHLAEEITQAVFIILAHKASSLGKDTILPAWLYRTTRFAAGNALKIQRRRQAREQEAYMQSTLNEPDGAAAWSQIAPLLDDAMEKLPEADRAAVVLRFFENRPWREVAVAMQSTEDAAQKRVTRALEKLRGLFHKRGVMLSATLIAGAVASNSVQAAPVGMAKTISVMAAAKGAAASTTTLTLMKGAMKVMAWTKVKTAMIVGAVVVLAAGTTTGLVMEHQARKTVATFGAATPVAAFRSAFAAMEKGDINAIKASYTPEFGDAFTASAGKGKSNAELAAMFRQIAVMLQGFEIENGQNVSGEETVLHLTSPRFGGATIPMKRIGGEWKINGNLATDKPTGNGP